MDIFSTLVGVTFRPAGTMAIVKSLAIGDRLYLEPEPDNAYDSNAIKVLDEAGNHLGYLSRESNAETAEWLAEGGEAYAEVVSFLSEIKPHLRITLQDTGEMSDYVPDEGDDG